MKALVYTEYAEKKIIITGIEANSLCGAEHKILDNFRRINNALAEDAEHMTNHFTGLIGIADMVISLQEFKTRYDAGTANGQATMNEAMTERDEIKREIEKTKLQLMNLETELENAEESIKEISERFKIPASYTAPEKIEKAHAAAEMLKAC